MQLIVYPRQYLTEAPGNGPLIKSEGDVTVSDLFAIEQGGMQDTTNLNFRFRTLDAAVSLFGDIRTWFRLQIGAPSIVGANHDFLLDTARFVATGERQMSPLVWLDIMGDTPSPVRRVHHVKPGEFVDAMGLTTPEFIQAWCAKPNGFSDMLQSLFVLFGRKGG